MPTVSFPTQHIIRLAGWQDSLEALAERIAMLGTDVEHVTEEEILVEVFPNRPDLLSHTLFAKALHDFVHGGRYEDITPAPGGKTYEIYIDSHMRDVRPYTLAAVVEDVTLSEEDVRLLIQLQEKLDMTHHRQRRTAAAGFYPLEKIRWPIRFTTINPDEARFTPLGMQERLTARDILIKHPKGKAYAHLLTSLTEWPAFIDADGSILSIPPITNSEETGRITPATRHVFIEVSGNHLPTIRVSLAILTMTLQLLGGTVRQVLLHYPHDYPSIHGHVQSPQPGGSSFHLTPRDAERLIGIRMNEETLSKALARMGHAYQDGRVTSPSYRADILHPMDIIEDIAISIGYEHIPAHLPALTSTGDTHPAEDHRMHLRTLLAEAGYHELPLLHLTTTERENRILGRWRKPVRMENPLTSQYTSFRRSIITPLLQAAHENSQERYPHAFYHVGRIAYQTAEGIHEEDELGILLTAPEAAYSDLRAVLEHLFIRLGIHDAVRHTPLLEEDIRMHRVPRVYWPGRSSIIHLHDMPLGEIGEVNPVVLRMLGIPTPVVIARLSLPLLPLRDVNAYRTLTNMPR